MPDSLQAADVEPIQDAIVALDEAGFDVEGIGKSRPVPDGILFDLTVAKTDQADRSGELEESLDDLKETIDEAHEAVTESAGDSSEATTSANQSDTGEETEGQADGVRADHSDEQGDADVDDDRSDTDIVEDWAREMLADEGHIEARSTDIAAVLGVDGRAVPWGLKRLEDADVEKVEADGSGSMWVVEPDGGDEGTEDDADDETANPYTPDDLGTLSVRRKDYDDSVGINIAARVVQCFDADRVHIRDRDGRVELAPGGHDDWPDYALRSRGGIQITNRRVIRGLLDVVPGDEVRAEEDGDVVVLEPQRCADRDRFVDCGPGTTNQYGRQKVLSLPIEAERLLDDPDHVYLRETDAGYEVHPGEHDDWPTYSQAGVTSKVRLGAQAIELLDIAMGEEVRARGDREREVIELAPPGREFPDPDENDGSDGVWRDYSGTSKPDDECENCGAELVDGYAAVFEPDDGDSVRCCPNCEDKIREGDGTVRPKRNVAGGESDD